MVWQSIKIFPLPWQTVGLHWFPPPPSLLIKHLHVLPSIMGILLAPCCSSLFWMTFFMLFCTTEGYHGTCNWAPPHVCCRGDRGTQTSQLLWFTESQPYTTNLLVPCCLHQPCQRRTDGGLYPKHCPCAFPLVGAAHGGADCHRCRIRESEPG